MYNMAGGCSRPKKDKFGHISLVGISHLANLIRERAVKKNVLNSFIYFLIFNLKNKTNFFAFLTRSVVQYCSGAAQKKHTSFSLLLLKNIVVYSWLAIN